MRLALDLGTRTGWAMEGDPVLYGHIDFKNGRYEGGGMRYLRFARWLDEILPSVTEVGFEEVRRHRGVDAAHVYGGMLAQLTSRCEHHKVPYRGYGVGAIKKQATGKGNADKGAMIATARAQGCATDDDNVADAWHLLRLMITQGGGS